MNGFEVLGHPPSSSAATDMRFRDGLLTGRLREEDLHLYDGTSAPVLFFNTFIITSAYHMPNIFRGLSKELEALLKIDDLNFTGAMAIAGLRVIKRWLERYHFEEVAKYQGQYPIMWADRENSPVINSLVTRRTS